MKKPTYESLTPEQQKLVDEKIQNLDNAIKEAMSCLDPTINPIAIFGFTSLAKNTNQNKGFTFIFGDRDNLVTNMIHNKRQEEDFRDLIDLTEDPLFLISMMLRR